MILLNDFRRQWEDTRADLERAFADVMGSGWCVLGGRVREFEEELAARWGLAHACGVGSGLDAIEIGLRALGCKSGDAVLTTPLSAFATTLAIVKLGAEPVFVDTDRYGLVDLNLCRSLLEKREDIRFFVPVHLYGHCLDMHELRRLRSDFSLLVVEDCAQSIGATFNGPTHDPARGSLSGCSPCGSAGQCAATSFYPTKNLGAVGDGGALLTNDRELDGSARTMRDYGQSAKYRHDAIGYNSRLDELQAALMHRAFLPRLSGWTRRRRAIAQRYLERIEHACVRCLGQPPRSDSAWHLFPVLVPAAHKARFVEHLKANGVAAGEHYPILIPDQRALAGVPYHVDGNCAVAMGISRSEVSLPIHPYLSDDEVDQVIRAVNLWKM